VSVKPHVKYSDLGRCQVGKSAFVFICDHPQFRRKVGWATTSKVLSILEPLPNGPVFETLNSIYHPATTDESFPDPSKALALLAPNPFRKVKS